MTAMRGAWLSIVAVFAALALSAGGSSAEQPDVVERGHAIFHASWVPPETAKEFTGLGPVFNTESCASCHVGNGRGAPARAEDRTNTSLVVKLAARDSGVTANTIRRYSNRLNYRAVTGVPVEGELTVMFETIEGRFADGESYTLQKPIFGFDKMSNGPVEKDTLVAVRMAPPIVGLGLL